jgi:hypothetical protein
MWFNILKESKQTSRTMGSVDWEKEEIPDEEEDDCKRWLQGLYDVMNKHQATDTGHPYAYKKGPSPNVIKLDKIPEGVACAVKDYYTNIGNPEDVDTNMISPIPYLEKYGIKNHYLEIDTYFEDYFSFDIYILERKDDNILLHAGVNFSWYDNGPFEDLWDYVRKQSSHGDYYIKRFIAGKDDPSIKICNYVKDVTDYLARPDIKDLFIQRFSSHWDEIYKTNDKEHRELNPKSMQYAVKKYFK